MATKITGRPPAFVVVRQTEGSAAADSGTIDMDTFPKTLAFQPYGRVDNIVVFWDGGGTIDPADKMSIQPLYHEVITDNWVIGTTITDLLPRTLAVIPTYGSAWMLLRISAVTSTEGEDLYICAASSDHMG